MTQLFSAYVEFSKSSIKSLERQIGQLSELVSILAKQRAMESQSQPIAAPLDTVEAMSTPTEDEEVEVQAEKITVEEDEEEDVEETPL